MHNYAVGKHSLRVYSLFFYSYFRDKRLAADIIPNISRTSSMNYQILKTHQTRVHHEFITKTFFIKKKKRKHELVSFTAICTSLCIARHVIAKRDCSKTPPPPSNKCSLLVRPDKKERKFSNIRYLLI